MLRGLGIGIPTIRRFLAGGSGERSAILRDEVAIRRMDALQVAERCVVTTAEAMIVDTRAGWSVEIYVNDPANVPPAALQTDLLLPLC